MILPLAHEAWISIGTSRLRTFLAMLGIVIGVGSVVLMMAVGMGSNHEVEESLKYLGNNMLFVTSISHNKGLRSSNMSNFTDQDVAAIALLPSVANAAGASYPRSLQASYGKLNWETLVAGTTATYFDLNDRTFAEGAPYNEDDIRVARRVAVIGTTVADKLFPDQTDRVGRMIRITDTMFTIIGVLQPRGADLNGMDKDNYIYVPITTAKNALWGHEFVSSMVQLIYVQATSADSMGDAYDELIALLRQRRHLRDADSNNFTINDMTSLQKVTADTTQALSLLLGAVASISLIVGGIGIMNIMLVTVTERTREIGIRKAIGATENQIMLQFLMEAVMIACVGSFVGLLTGFSGGFAAEMCFTIPVEYSMWAVLLALGVAIGIGVAAGIYPAWKAARLQPIEALRTAGG